MGRKYKSGTKLVEIKQNGRHYYGKTKSEARAKAVAYEEQQKIIASAGELFEDVARAWWDAYQHTIKQGTGKAYHANYQRAVDAFSGYRMRQISANDVNSFMLRLAAQGLKANTVSNARSVLSLIFKYWCGHMDGDANPVSLVDLPRGLARGERLPPTPEQIHVVQQHPEGFGLCAWLFMYTGARLGEVNALQWRDIDMGHKLIHITKSTVFVGNMPRVDVPKTKNAIRTISILEPLYNQLQDVYPRAHLDYFVLSSGPVPLTRSQYDQKWLAYCRSIGLAKPKENVPQPHRIIKAARNSSDWLHPVCTAHQFRHYMASLIYEATGGTNEMLAQKWLGHADIQTTHKVYTHVRDSQVGTLGDELNVFLKQQSQSGRKQ